jgi:hypothetical protein
MNQKIYAVTALAVALAACGGGGGGSAFSSGSSSSTSAPLVIAPPSEPTDTAPVSAEDLSGHFVDATGGRISLVGRDGVMFSASVDNPGTASFYSLSPRKAAPGDTQSSFKDNPGVEYAFNASLSGGAVRPFSSGEQASVSGSFDGKRLSASIIAGSRKASYLFSIDATNNEKPETDLLGSWQASGSLPLKLSVGKNGAKGYVVSGSFLSPANEPCTVFGQYDSSSGAESIPFRNVLSFNGATAGSGLSVTCSGTQAFKTALVGLNGSSILLAMKDVTSDGRGLLLTGSRASAPINDTQSSGVFVAGSGTRGHLSLLSGSAPAIKAQLIDLERDASGASKEFDRLVFSSFRMNDGALLDVTNSLGFRFLGSASGISDRVFTAQGAANLTGTYQGSPRASTITKTDNVGGSSVTTSLSLKSAFDAGNTDAGSMSGSFCAGDGASSACDIGTSVSVSSTTIQGTLRYAPCSDSGTCGSVKIDNCVLDGSLGDTGGVGVFDAAFSITCPGATQIVRNYLGAAVVVKLATGTESELSASKKLVVMAREAGNRDARVFIFKKTEVGAAENLFGAFISSTTNKPLDALVSDTAQVVLANNLAGRMGDDSMLFGTLAEDANGGISVNDGAVFQSTGPSYYGGMIQIFAKLPSSAMATGTTTADGSSIDLVLNDGNGTSLDATYSLFKRLAAGPGGSFSDVLNKDFCVTTVDANGAPVMGTDGKPVKCDVLQLTVDGSGAIQGKIDFPSAGSVNEDCSVVGILGDGSVEGKNIVGLKNFTVRCNDGVNFAFSGLAASIIDPAPGSRTDTVLHLLLRDEDGNGVRLRFAPTDE